MSMAHHPYNSVGQHGDANPILRAILKEYVVGKFDLHIGGHDHNLSDDGVVYGTRLFVTGAGGQLRPLKDAPAPGNWALSELGYITMTFTEGEQGRPLAHYDFKALDKDATGVYTGSASVKRSGIIQGNGLRP